MDVNLTLLHMAVNLKSTQVEVNNHKSAMIVLPNLATTITQAAIGNSARTANNNC